MPMVPYFGGAIQVQLLCLLLYSVVDTCTVCMEVVCLMYWHPDIDSSILSNHPDLVVGVDTLGFRILTYSIIIYSIWLWCCLPSIYSWYIRWRSVETIHWGINIFISSVFITNACDYYYACIIWDHVIIMWLIYPLPTMRPSQSFQFSISYR